MCFFSVTCSSGDLSRCPSDDLIFEDESERGSNALLARAWSPGWQNADKAFSAFINGPLIDYSVNRKKADSANTSLLSPYLHFGELSVRKVFHQVRMKQLTWSNESNHDGEEGCSLFLRSIGLREYSRYLAFNHPCSHEKPLLSHLMFFPWVVNEVYFKVWRQGRTGYPLVDAGMRELWATGWLHDRIRVVVSSFFVKVLQLPWRWGMKYFWDTLLDADLESDALGWQYISGSLPDGRELDRIDNPQVHIHGFLHMVRSLDNQNCTLIYCIAFLSLKATSSTHMGSTSDDGYRSWRGCRQNGYTTPGTHPSLCCRLQELS
jgi:cryptochrome 1